MTKFFNFSFTDCLSLARLIKIQFLFDNEKELFKLFELLIREF